MSVLYLNFCAAVHGLGIFYFLDTMHKECHLIKNVTEMSATDYFFNVQEHRKYFSYCTELSKILDNYIEVYVLLFHQLYCFPGYLLLVYYFEVCFLAPVAWKAGTKWQEKKLFLLHENILKLEVKLKSYDC